MPADNDTSRDKWDDDRTKETLNQLLEAMTIQTDLLRQLTNVTGSLAESESRESIVELIKTMQVERSLHMAAAAPVSSHAHDFGDDLESRSPADHDKLTVLAQYDELRASLGRKGASFYAAAHLNDDGSLLISGPAATAATSFIIGGRAIPRRAGIADSQRATWLLGDPPPEVFGDSLPVIELRAGERLIAIVRLMTTSYSYQSRTAV